VTQARALIEEAHATAGAIPDRHLQTRANLHSAQVCVALGEYQRASALLRENLPTEPDTAGQERSYIRVVSRAYLAACVAEMGGFAEALALGRNAVGQAECLDDVHPSACLPALAHVLRLKATSRCAPGARPGSLPGVGDRVSVPTVQLAKPRLLARRTASKVFHSCARHSQVGARHRRPSGLAPH
jgi:hypothetical protein